MTISSQTRKAGPFAGDGATVAYPFSFKVFSAADLLVAHLDGTTDIESTLVLNTDYTVSLNTNQDANPGGTVTLATAPASGATLVITSDIGYLQQTDLTNQGGFYPKVITDALDRLTIQAQQLKEEVDRAAKVRITVGEDAATLVDNINNLAAVLSGITTVAVPYQVFSGDGATKNFTLSSAPTSLAAIEVYVAGACKIPGTDYTLNGTTLTFTVAPPNAVNNIFARWIQVQATTAIEDGSVSTAKIAPSAVTTDKIAALGITTGRIADGAVTSIKLDPGGVTLPAGSTVQVPDLTDDSAKPAPTQWVKDLTASETQAGISELGTAAEYLTGTDPNRVLTLKTARDNNLVRSAATSTTSGKFKDVTGIPAWAKRITIVFNGVSLTGADYLTVELGDSGGIETSGYVSTLSSGSSAVQDGTCFLAAGNSSGTSTEFMGAVTLFNVSGNTWVMTGVTGSNGISVQCVVNGRKTLSDTLTQLRVTTFVGTLDFDAGSFSVFWE